MEPSLVERGSQHLLSRSTVSPSPPLNEVVSHCLILLTIKCWRRVFVCRFRGDGRDDRGRRRQYPRLYHHLFRNLPPVCWEAFALIRRILRCQRSLYSLPSDAPLLMTLHRVVTFRLSQATSTTRTKSRRRRVVPR